MTFGPHAQTIIKAALAHKHAIPEDAKAPSIPIECGFAYCAFRELSTTREQSFDVGEIPWTAIRFYAETYGVRDVDEFEMFVFYIRAMDEAWRSTIRKR